MRGNNHVVHKYHIAAKRICGQRYESRGRLKVRVAGIDVAAGGK